MKLRLEPSGFHWFDRSSGTHVLVDEVAPAAVRWSVAPRTLSIALSNACDLACHFCYRPHNAETLPVAFVQQVAAEADRLGALEVTFGGGEPLLYPRLVPLCEWIWTHTHLGISLTTHGHHLTLELVRQLAGVVSSLRFSIDGGEPYYSQVRGRPLTRLLRNIGALRGAIPFGINVVVSPGHTAELPRVAELAIELGARDLLIIPEHRNGETRLRPHEWREVEEAIAAYRDRCRLAVTYEACKHLTADLLPTEGPDDFVFAHISAGRMLQRHSYARAGIPILDPAALRDYFLLLSERKGLDETLANVLQ